MAGHALDMVVRRGQRVWMPLVVSGRAQRLAHGASQWVLGLGAVLALGAVVCWWLISAAPAWWSKGQVQPAGLDRSRLATAVDNGAWSEITAVRPLASGGLRGSGGLASEPWVLSISANSANAWLNEQLPGWLGTSGLALPPGTEWRAAFEPGVVRLGVRLPDGGEGRVVSLRVTPKVDVSGVWLADAGVAVGRLDVPTGMVIGGSDWAGPVLRGESPVLPNGVLRLPDGRLVRVLDVNVRAGKLVLTLRTEANSGFRPGG